MKPEARADVRVRTQFPMSFSHFGEEFKSARASDISVGGFSMSADELLSEGSPIDVRFTLPADVLELLEDEAERKPFPEYRLRACVIWRRVIGHGLFAYGLAFDALEGPARADVARYVAAMRIAKQLRQ